MYETFRKMVADLESLDATIVQFDPNFRVQTLKPKGFRPPSEPGPDVPNHPKHLGQAIEPLTSREIALLLLWSGALDKSDLRLLRLMTKQVWVALRIQRDNGAVRCEQGPRQYMLWAIER